MKKGSPFIHNLVRFYSRAWHLIILIGLLVSVQTSALNTVREPDLLRRSSPETGLRKPNPNLNPLLTSLGKDLFTQRRENNAGSNLNSIPKGVEAKPSLFTTAVSKVKPDNSRGNALTLSPVDLTPIKVNFQDPTTVPPAGWLKDYGQSYGARTGANQGTNMEYGWRRRSTNAPLDLSVGGTAGNGRKRTAPADILLATLMHMQAQNVSGTFNGTPIEGYWEIKVPNGVYDVTVSAGDGNVGTDPESHSINVEGVNAISNFVPTGAAGALTRFKSGTARATVTDGFLTINADGGTNTKINTALIQPVNQAPTIANAIAAQTATAGTLFTLNVSNTFADPDGDALTLSATLADGSALPGWLSFTPGTKTFSGTPSAAASLSIKVSATDSQAATDATFTLTINAAPGSNHAPTVANPVTAQTATAGTPYSLDLTNTFADQDAADVLTLTATLSGGGALPVWLSFNPATKILSGTPTAAENLNIKVTASDSQASIDATFALTVNAAPSSNHAPTVANPVTAQTATAGTPYSLDLTNTFADQDAADVLTLTATLSGGGALPAWLSFNPATKILSGTPTAAENLNIKVTASDSQASIDATFALTVNAAPSSNHAPTIANPVAAQTATAGTPYSLDLTNTFADQDAADVLTLSATLADGGALPAWLSFNPSTKILSGNPTAAANLNIKVTASDSQASVDALFALTVNAAPSSNHAPTIANPVAAQTATVGISYSLDLTNTFADQDAADVLTLTATLAGGGALPAWLTFNPANKTLSGIPTDAGALNIKVTASDSQASVDANFALTVNPAPVAGCSPMSTLPCNQINVTLPFALNFDGSQGGILAQGGLGTGFTMVDVPSGARAANDGAATSPVTGYEVSKLSITDGKLNILSGQGIAYLTNNNQINALGAGVANAHGKLIYETSIVNPFQGSNSQQGGLWLGLNDKTFIKLAVVNNTIEMRKEVNDISTVTAASNNPYHRVTGTLSGLSSQTIRIRLVLDLINNKVEGYYSTNGTTYTNVGLTYVTPANPFSIDIADMALGGKTVYGGIYTTYRTANPAPTTLAYSFDDFSIKQHDFPVVTAPFRLNAGGGDRTVNGAMFSADATYALIPGETNNTQTTITGAGPVPELYYERRFGTYLGYYLPIANGFYTVKLHMVENTATSAGSRVFGVKIENAAVLTNYDLWVDGGNRNKIVIQKSFNTQVTDGVLNIDFAASVDKAMINAIEVLPVGNQTPIVANPIPDQNAITNVAYSLTIPANTFTDPEGSALTLTATLANGDPLPAGLTFASNTLQGTLTAPNVYIIKISASDGQASISDEFNLTVGDPVNQAPTVANAIADKTVIINTVFDFVVPENTFADADNDPLTITATLADGSALPVWLEYNPTTKTFHGTPNALGELTVRLTANDGKASIFEDFKITVGDVPVNQGPTLAQPIPAQTATVSLNFSYTVPAATFADAENDPLTFVATLADGSALPTWLSFNPATRLFSGTPDAAGPISLRVTASDAAHSVNADFTLTVNPAPLVCTPISTLPCEQINVTLPFTLTFDGTQGGIVAQGGLGTGFTMIDAPSGARAANDGAPTSAVTGYEVSKLTIAGGRLNIVANQGIAFQANNNQLNALGAGVPNAHGKLIYETTIVNPVSGTNAQQGGLWVGLNDKTFIKLSVTNNTVELRKEAADVSSTLNTTANPNQRATGALANVNTQTFRLRLVLDLINNKVEGYYSTNGTTYTNVGLNYITPANPFSIDIADMALGGKTIYGGIYTTYRQGTAGISYSFDDFSIKQHDFPVVTAPFRLNAGGGDRTVNGALFSADATYALIPGETNNTATTITGAGPVPELYYERRFGTYLGYYLPIANGFYTVNLHMVENTATSAGSRVFDVKLENNTVLDDLDLFVDGGNVNKKVIVKTFNTHVTDGVLNIDFAASADKAMINAIEILPAANQAPIVANPIGTQTATVGNAYTFVVPVGTFTDPEGAPLTLTATLADGSALPAGITFDANTATFGGTPTEAGNYSIKLSASDGTATTPAFFSLNVKAQNSSPIAVTNPENQVITAGQAFSFVTGSFSDPDAGDVLTYSATLQNGDVLPAWLSFNASNQTFSGLAPATLGEITVKLTATDIDLASISKNFTVTIEAAPAVTPCLPISSLPCESITVPLPFAITFDGSEGGLADKNNLGTGFTMALAPSGSRVAEDGAATSEVTGFEPSKLTVTGGRLSIVTNRGISFQANNNQLNTLGVGTAANGKLTLETTIVNPFSGSGSEQGGLWFGLSDKTFIKLSVSANKVEMRKEVNDASSTATTDNTNLDQRITATIAGLNNQTVRLRLVINNVTHKAEGFYSTDGQNYLNVGATYTLPSNPAAIDITNMGFAGQTAYAGIYTTQRTSTTARTYNFENFSLVREEVATKTLAFAPNSLDFTAIQGQAVTAKTTTLTASEGSPTVTFTSTSASWLTLPAATLGTVTFGPSNLSSSVAPGLYEATVTASAPGYEPTTLIVAYTVTTAAVAAPIKINFQDPATVPPTGWLKDYGQPLGLRTGTDQGTNLEYGWKRRSNGALLDLSVGGTIPGNGRRRTAPADLLLATFMHMQANNVSGTFNGTPIEGYWEIKVPNGIYDVTVSAGDGNVGTDPESHKLNVEGIAAFPNFVPTGAAGSLTRFKSGTVRATVTDGYLTINADGGTNTKINSALITPIDVTPFLVWSASEHSLAVEKGTPETDYTFSLDIQHSSSTQNLPITMTAVYGAGATDWLVFNASHNGDEPNVTFDYSAAKNLPVGTYTATVTASATNHNSAGTLIRVTVIAAGANQPYVVSSTPANGATNVSVNIASVAANSLFVPEVAGFNGGVDNATLTTNSVQLFKISGGTTSQISGTVQGTGGGDAISFTPTYALEPNTTYRFNISNQVKSHSGAAFLPYEATFTTGNNTVGTPNPVAAEFAPKVVIPSTVGKKYTSILFGPDDKFYALRLDGVIERFDVDHTTGMLSSPVEIKTLTNKYGLRSSVGLTFDPASTPTNLIAYISHCSAGLSNAPEFDGNISRLSGADLGTEQLILTKLPRSKADHLVNSIAFGPDGAMYFNQGSLSSMGLYDGTWQRDESLLSATVLRLDFGKMAGVPLPLDVRTTSNQTLINAAPSDNFRMSDGTYNPYATTSPLTIYASGVRNAFDLIWHSNGQLYVPANGSAAGGNSPASVAGTRLPNGSTYAGPSVITTTSIKVQNDWLFRVNPLKPVGYYGHPHPLRGQYVANRGYLDNPKYPASQGPDINYRGAAYNFELNKSPNGVIEYKSNAFNGAMKGRILVCRFSGGSDIIVLEPGTLHPDPSVNTPESDDHIYDIIGAQTGSGTDGITGLSGFTNPLDIAEDVQNGNLYVVEYNWNNISGKTAQIVMLKASTPSTVAGIATVTPERIIDNDVIGGAAGKNHTVTVANTGNAPLSVTGITLAGTDANQFQLLGAPSPSVSTPTTIARGSAITFNVAFNPTTVGVKKATLTITSVNNAAKVIPLSGLGTVGQSGTNEPSLQLVLDTYDIKVNVGDDNKNTNIIHSTNYAAPLLGDEISIQKFQRATDGNVIIEPLSVFGPTDAAGIVTGFGWYLSGNASAKNELFTVANSNFQTVDVQYTGVTEFDPGLESFGFYSHWPFFANRHLYSEDALNNFSGAVPHHVRVYPLKNADGTVVENAYVIATEENTSGWDYQDVVVIARNVKPVIPVTTKELTLSNNTLNFSYTPGVITPAKAVTLSANVGTPAITLTTTGTSPWLTLPAAVDGTLSFSVDGSSLTPGNYTETVTASADGYTSAVLTISLTVNPAGSGAILTASNQELIFDALKNTTVSKRLTVTNTGIAPLTIQSVALGGNNPGKFTVSILSVEGEPAGNVIGPDEMKSLQVTFTPGNNVNTYDAVVTITSNAANANTLNVNLYAMSLNGYEGANEPPLQTVVNTLGYGINVGWTTLADGTAAVMKGDEVPVQLFERANSGPVMISPVARYSPNQELPFGFYTNNNNTPQTNPVGTLSGIFGQHNTLFPQIVAGTNQFNPGLASFGIYVVGLEGRLSYTQDALNSSGPTLHAVRTYPMKDRNGIAVPNSYLVCFEDASNGDYQDYMFVLSNVEPAGTRKTLSFSARNLDWNAPVNGTVVGKSITLNAANGTPSTLTLKKSASNNWAVLPSSPALGSMSIGINTLGLSAGTYTDTLFAQAPGFLDAYAILTLRLTDVGANAIRVNYQLSTTTTPAGYMADIGLPYNDTRGYGWINPTTKAPKDQTASMRERTSATVETRLRTFAIMQSTASPQTPGNWEMKVSPGQYNVTVGVGDIGFTDSNHSINVEGVSVISNFVPTAQELTRIATTTVMVTDGKLTIDPNGGTNTKICFVIIDPATADTDFSPPVATVQLNGTLQSPGVYMNQVTATITATDLGGSNVAQVLYSFNNGPFEAYFSPLLINTAGSYSFRAKAIDGNANETITNPVTFSVVKPTLSNANILVENLDVYPSNNQLTFSRIQEPWRREDDGNGVPTPYNRNHDVVKAKITNKGTGSLVINNLTLSNPTGWKIAQINNVVYDPATAAPITIAPNGSIQVSVQFIATYPSGRVRVLHDTLSINSNDDATPKKKIVLSGLWQSAGEGGNEPRAQEIIGAFGFKSNTGFNSSDGTNTGNSLILNTDEILSSFFLRADATKPVTVYQMAAYHGCCAAVESFQYYTKGTSTISTLFQHHPLDGQSLLPLKNSSTAAIASGSWTPATNTAFGFKVAGQFSDRTRNSEGKIGLRVWKAIDGNGSIIPNSYIIGQDYIGNPGVTNYDYQDNVYFVSNVKPEMGSSNFSELAATPSAPDFGAQQIGTTNTMTVTLKNLGQTYANGSSDPAITIGSLSISGANSNEFTISAPATTVLAIQESTTVTVTFKPNSQGIKNAALFVNYNSGPSPLRIPLYGIANTSCNVISVVKRIKSGSNAAVTVNGKTWEADQSYRQGSVQLDAPAVTPIGGTDDDVLYQSYLSAAADLAETRYLIPIANGSYKVRMHFIENFFQVSGSRVFSVNMENQVVLPNYDIFKDVGYKNAVVKDFDVIIADGKLDLKFNPIANRVAIAALEIFANTQNAGTIALNQQSVLGAECGVSNGSITLGVTNSSVGSYLYKAGQFGAYQSSPTLTNLPAGPTIFYVKENVTNGCETSAAFTIPQRNNMAFTVTSPVLDCPASYGSATVSGITGGTNNYSVVWVTNPVQTGMTATVVPIGTYNVTVNDASGCSLTKQVTIARDASCPPPAIRINSGGTQFVASGDRYFGPDQYFGGTDRTGALDPVQDIVNTTDDALYITERSAAAFNYNIPVSNGTMTVILHFAETYFGVPGKAAGVRKFHVNIEGVRKLTNYDIATKAGGALRPTAETFPITVTDGFLNIDFLSGSNNIPKISAIEVIPLTATPNSAPVLAAIGNKSTKTGQLLTFTATATDADASQTKTFTLTGAGVPAGASIDPATGVFTWTPTVSGTSTFSVTVTDNGSPALSDSKPVTITVADNVAPVLATIENKTVVAGQTLTFTATATDDPSQTKTFSLTGAPAGATITTAGVFTWTPSTADTYKVTVVVTDNGTPPLSSQQEVTIVVNPAPVSDGGIRINAGGALYSSPSGKTFIADKYFGGTNRTTSIAAVDIQNTTDDVLYLSERSSAAFNYTIPVPNGAYNVILHFAETYWGVAAGSGTGTGKRKFNVDIEGVRKLTNYDIFVAAGGGLRAVQQTFPITVTDEMMNIVFATGTADLPKISAIEVVPQVAPTNQPPVLASIGVKTATVNQAFTFTATATDPDAGQTKTFSMTGAPAGATINPTTGVFNWTPSATGTVNPTIVVTDNGSPALSAQETISITVSAAPNVAPVLAAIGGKNATVGTQLTFTATATDADAGQTKTFTLINAPAGAAITTAGVFTWTPTTATGSPFSATIVVTDNGSPALSAQETISITVTAPVAANGIRINSGGAAFAASGGRQFIADTYFRGTNRTGSIAAVDILNTTDDALYLSERSSAAFNYAIPVSNGSMQVILHFAETFWGVNPSSGAGPNKRKFNVDIEGARKLTNFDIFVAAGGGLRAITQTFPVTVSDGTLNIEFLQGTADLPKISAIEVIPDVVVPPTGPTTVTLAPVADALVRNGTYSTVNYGNETTLFTKFATSDGFSRSTYLKFGLGTATNITSAKLRIYGNNIESAIATAVTAYAVDNDNWTETGVTWANGPTSAAAALGTVNVNNVAQYYEIDVTAYAQAQAAGDKTMSLQLKQPTQVNRSLIFNSKENASNPPQLVIVSGGSGGARISQEDLVEVEVAESVVEVEYEKSIIYPNPIRNQRFTLEVSKKHSSDVALKLISPSGRIFDLNVPGLGDGGKKEVDVSRHSLTPGVYLLKVHSKSATEVIKLLVME